MLLPRRPRDRSLGLEPRAPFPKGHVLEQGDWSLLEAVRGRPRMWRDVDGKGALRWPPPADPDTPRPTDAIVDVLIIGAGASGAAVAWSLAETRMKILCLEQGDWIKPTDFPTNGRDWEARRYRRFRHQPQPARAGHRLSRSTTTTRR